MKIGFVEKKLIQKIVIVIALLQEKYFFVMSYKFDNTKTIEMKEEIDKLNQIMLV